jgi:hypothetical protein
MIHTILTHKPLLSFTGEVIDGNVRNDTNDHVYTVITTFNRFTGHVYIEGTLELNPTEADWFAIDTLKSEFVEFTGTLCDVFNASLMFVRMRVDRSHLPAEEYDMLLHGAVVSSSLRT